MFQGQRCLGVQRVVTDSQGLVNATNYSNIFPERLLSLSLCICEKKLKIAKVITPTTIPSLILPTTAMTRITSTVGIASTGLVRLMCFIDANIWKLTTSKIAPVTTEGIAGKIGEKNIAAQKHSAVTAAVTPVLPPSALPLSVPPL